MKHLLLVILWSASSICFGQTIEPTYLNFQDYLDIVIENHPLSRQAFLQNEFADIERLKARGVIDPKLSSSFESKNFEGSDYFDLFKSEIKIPTVLGIDVKASFETNSGAFLNPENFTTNRGIWSAGLEMDVLRDWAYNDRKQALDLAEIFQEQSQNVQALQINQLLVDAGQAYLEWYTATENVKIIQENLELAETYLTNIKDAVLLGDKPAIDTIEAKTILLDQFVKYQEEELKRVKSKFKVNNFLWDGNQMIFLSVETQPITPYFIQVRNSVNPQLFFTHPEVVEKQIKLDQLGIARKIAKQGLLPELKLGYNPLVNTAEDNIIPSNADVSFYKIGASFAVPLFRRKEKAELQKTELKQKSTQFDIDNKANELFIKWNIESNNISNINQQITFLNEAQENYEALAEAELIRYNYGESSVFLVNKRLEKLVENRLKIQKLRKSQFIAQLVQLYLQDELYER